MKDRVFRDPVHGLVELVGPDREFSRILETRAFQRLRRIRQMGFAWLVYPGAEHSRFGHALGAYHMADRVCSSLSVDPQVARHVKVAALLHDIGHGPFSHAWEQAFPSVSHETWGERLVTGDPELAETLEDLEPELPATLEAFWQKRYRPSFACKLVSSQLDVDRLDYLLRDGHYSGAGYATYDVDWILYALRTEAVREGRDPLDLVIDYRRGMYAVEQYLFARTYMYAQVYHHKTVRAAEWMFLKLLERFRELSQSGSEPAGLEPVARLARGETLDTDAFLWLDDGALFAAFDTWGGQGVAGAAGAAEDPLLRDLAWRLVRRRLFKTIDLGDDARVIEGIREPVYAAARARFGDAARFYVHFDNATQVGYRGGEAEELHVVGHPRHGTVTLGELLENLPLGRPVSMVRLVCAPELVEDLRPIAEAALSG